MAGSRRRHSGKGRHRPRRGINRSVITNRALTRGGNLPGGPLSSHTRPAMPQQPSHMVAMVNADLCAGCGICRDICPVGAITVGKIAELDPERCIGCGSCVEHCPQDALTLFPMDGRLYEKAADAL